MKMNLKKTLLIGITTILCATSLASCGSVKLQSGENGLYDKKNDISYSHASPVYEATSLLKEYGKLAVTDSESYTLFTIPGADPTEMLATEDFNIIYASSMDMPTLSEMAPSVLRMYVLRDAVLQVKGGAGLKDIQAVHLKDMEALCMKGSGKRLDLPGLLTCERRGTQMLLYTEANKQPKKRRKAAGEQQAADSEQ